ncbi:MAG: hypothetical protein R3F61_04795 [Myxococcota bacterium]
MDRAARKLDTLERAVDALEASGGRRQRENAHKQRDVVAGIVAALAPGPETAALKARLDQASARIAARIAIEDARAATDEDAALKLLAARGDGSYARWVAELEDLRQLATRLSVLTTDSHAYFADAPVAADLQRWPAAARSHASFVWETLPGIEVALRNDRLGLALRELARLVPQVDARLAELRSTLPRHVERQLQETLRWARDAVDHGSVAPFSTRRVQGERTLATDRLRLEAWIEACAALDPQVRAGLEARVAAVYGELDELQGKLADAIVAANRLPANDYSGADRPALEALALDGWPRSTAIDPCSPCISRVRGRGRAASAGIACTSSGWCSTARSSRAS